VDEALGAVAAELEPEPDAFPAASPEAVVVDPPSLDAPSPPPVDAPSLAFVVDALGAVVVRRSFLAQPDPLKWKVGRLKAFFTGPLPQTGQVAGGSAWTPWTTSNRVPQAAQS
jgi:hypothetical protein